ncbi:hypothetical protein [Dyadobacter sp.]|uniref:hypothetical protein n=1 Tax=Dyadobacter sp. TaxID=1914288 RepID=UPI003F6FE13D
MKTNRERKPDFRPTEREIIDKEVQALNKALENVDLTRLRAYSQKECQKQH